MPKKIKTYSKAVLDDTALLKMLYLLCPNNDPVKKKLKFLCKKSAQIFGFESKSYNIEDTEIKKFLSEKLMVLDTLDKSYANVRGRDNLKAVTKRLKKRTLCVLEGLDIGRAPGRKLLTSDEPYADITDDMPAPAAEKDPNYAYLNMVNDQAGPDALEKAFDDIGLTQVNKDLERIEAHDREWAKEQDSANPDPVSLRAIGDKLQKDMYSLDEHMDTFSNKYLTDLKKPEKERTVSPAAVSAVSGASLPLSFEERQNNKDEFTNELESQLVATDLKELQRTINSGENKALSKTVQDTIDSCTAREDEEEEEKRRRLKKDTQFIYALRVIQLKQLEAEAAKYNDPFAQKAAAIAKEHLKDPTVLKMMSDVENSEAEKAVESIDLAAERKNIQSIQNTYKKTAEVKGIDNSFEAQKKRTMDMLADMLAVQTIAKTIKSYKAAMDDMEREGVGNAMADKELDSLTSTLLTEKNIRNYSDMIKSRPDFKRMMNKIKTPEQLEDIKLKALDGSGRQIMEELYKYSRQIIREDTNRARMEQQQLEQTMQMNRVVEPPVLKPNDYFNDD